MACPHPQVSNPIAHAAMTAVYNIKHMGRPRRGQQTEPPRLLPSSANGSI